MALDYLGNETTTEDPDALGGVNDFVGGFLGYEARIVNVLAVADRHPESLLANVYAGFVAMFLEAPEATAQAGKYLAAAEAVAAGANPREAGNLALLKAWVGGDVPAALAVADRIIDDTPRDLAVVKLLQYLEFNRGNSPAMLRAVRKVLPVTAEIPHVHGMAAFALEQCHLLPEAEAAARQAITLQRKEPWAQHALAHVLLTQGRIEEGIEFLESVKDTWQELNSFMYTHNWWHLAVFYLSRGRRDKVLEIYDQHLWSDSPWNIKSYSQDQIGAVQLLTRLELAGFSVDGRWADLAPYLAARSGDTVQPFLSLLYLYGLARAGRPEADTLLQAIRREAESAPPFVRETWSLVTLPAAEGLLAYARGDNEEAVRRLRLALPGLVEIGGSHAQRDLFEQIFLSAALGAGRLLPVQQSFELRRAGDPRSYPVNRVLADLYGRLGLEQEAQRARSALRELDAADAVNAVDAAAPAVAAAT